MLQQTRVSVVVPYFERWMRTFPDFPSLAVAEEPDVLHLWQGLGYYSRARNLLHLARAVVRDGVPETPENWSRLPGVGPYTAAAVASIAQDQPVPVIDGNVVRVLSRLTGDTRRWKNSASAIRDTAPAATEFLDRKQPGRHNEAVMELGALVCLPRSPLCTVCPLMSHCRAAATGTAETIPQIGKAAKTRKTIRRAWALQEDTLLLYRHPQGSRRLAGLLELPTLDGIPSAWHRDPAPLARRKRGIANESITEFIHSVTPDANARPGKNTEWIPLADLDAQPLSGPHRHWIGEIIDGISVAPKNKTVKLRRQ